MARPSKRKTVSLAAAILLAADLAGAAGAAKIYVIRDATVHTMGSAGTIPHASVVIIDNKIAGVGPNVRALAVGGSSSIIEGRGLEVYPGLVDAWSNIGLTEISSVPATNDSTETGDFNPQLLAFSAVHPSSEHIPVARVNGITTCLSAPAGGIVSGQATLLHLDGWTTDEMVLLRSAGVVINFPSLEGDSRSGAGEGTSPESRRVPFSETRKNYEKRVNELSDLLAQARHYEKARAADPGTPRDVRLESLIPVVQGRTPVFLQANSAGDIRNAVEFARRESLKAVIRGGRDANKVAELLKKESVPVILDSILRLPSREDDPYDAIFTLPRDLAKAGVRFALTSPNSANVRNLPYEAGFAEAYGLAHEDALRAITLSPAEILGVADRIGTIEAGKIADVVVTDGDILEIRTQIKHLFIAGKSLSLETRHSRLYQKYLTRQ
jgi:imidazolonepropionase-like amidohydrolase